MAKAWEDEGWKYDIPIIDILARDHSHNFPRHSASIISLIDKRFDP
jgi:hypothetical protein